MNSILSRAGGLVNSLVDTIKTIGKHEGINEDRIQVCVRVRPILRDEREDSFGWTWKDNALYPRNPAQASYCFDHLFTPDNSNKEIFDAVIKATVLQSMNGFHGTVFTYGQTSSGKTFTMNGTQSQPGIIPQSILYCFDSIQDSFRDREFLIRVSYLEVYNEQIKDLLSTEPTQIKIQYDTKLGTILSGVKEQVVLNSQQVIALLKAGEAHRHVGNTDMNEKSSRAHTLLKMIIESKQRGETTDSPVRVSVLNLVDLAGSENAKMTNSIGERAREAKCINQSLLTLSLIIQRLSKEKAGATQKAYLPYRDSKLTRLLQSSLSGKARIAIICTVSPTLRCVEESHNTLKFAARAKKIKTVANINELMDDKTLLRAYKIEIHTLKARLANLERENISQILIHASSPDTQCSERGSTSSTTGPTTDSVEDSDEAWYNPVSQKEDESEEILQMISEMERLILKSDLSVDKKKVKPASNSRGTSRIPGIARSMEFNRKSGLRPPNALSTAHGDHLKAKNGIKSSKIKDNNIPITEDSIRCVGNGSLEHLTEIDKLWGSTELIPGAQCSSSNNHADEVGGESTDYLHVADSCFGDGEDYSKHRPTVQSNLSPKSSNFGFIPSPSLSRSFIKIAKDMEPTDSTVVVTASSSIESDLLDNSGIATLESVQCKQRDDAGLRCNLTPDERPCGTGEHNAARGSQINAEDPNNNDNNESLFSVTQMLAVLKHYVEKSSTIKRRSVNAHKEPSTIGSGRSPRLDATPTDVQKKDYSRLATEFRCLTEDYKHLQGELEKKDELLAMLTQGLREVEASQERWLDENEILFRELEAALEENLELAADITRLKQYLEPKEFSQTSAD